MLKFQMMDALAEAGNGYLCTADVLAQGISKTTLAEYVRTRRLERVAYGVYMTEDAWPDELYRLNLRNRRICYSHETALYLHGMMEREPTHISVTVPIGYNAGHLREKGVKVHQVKPMLYDMGLTVVETSFGNRVTAYDRERTLCDMIKNKKAMDIQVFQTALREYMKAPRKNLPRLMEYAAKMKMEEDVRLYTEVML